MVGVCAFFAPNIHLARAKEDVCDGCFAIDTELSNPSLSPERREELLAWKHTQIEDAIIQRRTMQALVKLVVKKEAPDHVVPDIFLPDYVDDGKMYLKHYKSKP